MGRYEKLLEKILHGTSDASISFTSLCPLMERLGFELRVKGSHHIFTMDGVEEILNFQPKGDKAKPYQVVQARNVILRHKLADKMQ